MPDEHPLFTATKISRDKERQVQHYVELLRALPLWERDRIRVVDAGCGKAYMSLALVAYGREVGTRVELVGLDANAGVIETVRGIAEQLGYDEASFEATTIADYAGDGPVDLLVSLHACDTASDEAIAAGVRLGAEAIVVAPCCHHELAGQLAKRSKDGVLRHGVLLGRQADLVTDALRAAALETPRLPSRRDRVRRDRAHTEERDAARRALALGHTSRTSPARIRRSSATTGRWRRRSSACSDR